MTATKQVLDVACGTFPYQAQKGEKVTSVDFRASVAPDILHDLNTFPYPFDDEQLDKIYASHIMEHLRDHIRFMEELYRVAKPNAQVIIRVPHFSGRSAWCDPTHVRAYSLYQFRYYSAGFRDHYGNCDFAVESVQLRYTRFHDRFLPVRIAAAIINRLAAWGPDFCERTWCYGVGGFSEVYATLKVKK